jgi:hypothetical protein
MLLNEFIYFKENDAELSDDNRYNPLDDKTILTSKDLRKTRLTLRMLNDLRKAGDARDKEQKEHLEFVKVMYAPPPPEAAAV